MGTSQDIAKKIIANKLKWIFIAISPLLLLGVSSIAYQFYKISKNDSFTFSDVDVTNLWPYSSKVEKPIENALELSLKDRRVYKIIGKKDKLKRVVHKRINTFKSHKKIRKETKAKNTTRVKKVELAITKLELSPMEFKSFPQINRTDLLPSGKYANFSSKEHLFSKDLILKESKWAIGASFTPSLTYRRLVYYDIDRVATRITNGIAYVEGQSLSYRKENDKALISFSSGFDLYWQPVDKWSFQIGLYYTSLGEQIQVVKDPSLKLPNRTKLSDKGDAFNGYVSNYKSPENTIYNELDMLPFNNYYGLIEIPLNARYTFLNKGGVSFGADFGVSFSFLDHVDALLYNYTSGAYYWFPTSDSELFNSNLWSGMVGLSISQYISREVEIFANPQFKYFFTPTFSNSYELKQNQWTTGVKLGIKYHL